MGNHFEIAGTVRELEPLLMIKQNIYVLTQPLKMSWLHHMVNFEAGFYIFEFRFFFLFDQLPQKGYRASLSNYLPMAGRRRFGFILSLSELAQFEIQNWLV